MKQQNTERYDMQFIMRETGFREKTCIVAEKNKAEKKKKKLKNYKRNHHCYVGRKIASYHKLILNNEIFK